MKLNDYKEEIYKCSGCGLCQGVCPVYKVDKKECSVSRGKFNLLNAILNRDADFSKRTLEIMDNCLHCNKCSEFCPSGIDAQKIIETAKQDMMSCGIFSVKKLIIAKIFANKIFMKILRIFINIIRNLKILEMINIFNCPNNKLARRFLKIKIKRKKSAAQTEKTMKILYFGGCINNYINPSCKNAAENILQDTCAELIEADFNCCGLPLKTAGDIESFKKIAKENIKKALENDFDYLVFDCASCKSTFLGYTDVLDGEEKEQAQNLSGKIISIYELLNITEYTPKQCSEKITFHFPCHIDNREKAAVKKLLNNFDYAECSDTCCGAAGSYFAFNHKISGQININKAKDIKSLNVQTVLTCCPSCLLGLNRGLIAEKSDTEVCQLIEFLNR